MALKKYTRTQIKNYIQSYSGLKNTQYTIPKEQDPKFIENYEKFAYAAHNVPGAERGDLKNIDESDFNSLNGNEGDDSKLNEREKEILKELFSDGYKGFCVKLRDQFKNNLVPYLNDADKVELEKTTLTPDKVSTKSGMDLQTMIYAYNSINKLIVPAIKKINIFKNTIKDEELSKIIKSPKSIFDSYVKELQDFCNPKIDSNKDIDALIRFTRKITSPQIYDWQRKEILVKAPNIYSSLKKAIKSQESNANEEQKKIFQLLNQQLNIVSSAEYLTDKIKAMSKTGLVTKTVEDKQKNKRIMIDSNADPTRWEIKKDIVKYNIVKKNYNELKKVECDKDKKSYYNEMYLKYQQYSYNNPRLYSDLDKKIIDLDLAIDDNILTFGNANKKEKFKNKLKILKIKNKEQYKKQAKLVKNRIDILEKNTNIKVSPKIYQALLAIQTNDDVNRKSLSLLNSFFWLSQLTDNGFNELKKYLMANKKLTSTTLEKSYDIYTFFNKFFNIKDQQHFSVLKSNTEAYMTDKEWGIGEAVPKYLKKITNNSDRFSTIDMVLHYPMDYHTSKGRRNQTEEQIKKVEKLRFERIKSLVSNRACGKKGNTIKEELDEGKVVLLATAYSSAHHALVAVEKRNGVYHFDMYDSHRVREFPAMRNIVGDLAKCMGLKNNEYSITHKNSFQQGSTGDCTVFASLTARLLVENNNNLDIETDEINVSEFRRHIIDTMRDYPYTRKKLDLDKIKKDKVVKINRQIDIVKKHNLKEKEIDKNSGLLNVKVKNMRQQKKALQKKDARLNAKITTNIKNQQEIKSNVKQKNDKYVPNKSKNILFRKDLKEAAYDMIKVKVNRNKSQIPDYKVFMAERIKNINYLSTLDTKIIDKNGQANINIVNQELQQNPTFWKEFNSEPNALIRKANLYKGITVKEGTLPKPKSKDEHKGKFSYTFQRDTKDIMTIKGDENSIRMSCKAENPNDLALMITELKRTASHTGDNNLSITVTPNNEEKVLRLYQMALLAGLNPTTKGAFKNKENIDKFTALKGIQEKIYNADGSFKDGYVKHLEQLRGIIPKLKQREEKKHEKSDKLTTKF